MTVRKNAMKIILEVNKGAFLWKSLDKYRNYDEMPLLREITSGVIRNKTYLDYLIEKSSKIKFKKIHEKILTILELSLYQIIFMDNIPSYTIVDEAVKLAKEVGNRGSIGYVNGMLRNIIREKDFSVDLKGLEYLSTFYSHSLSYVKYIISLYGEEKGEKILKLNNSEAPFTIRTNTLKISREELLKKLKENYIVQIDKLTDSGLKIENPRGILDSDEFKKGFFYVQDSGSILISQVLNPRPGSKVLDMCAAPGGKTAHMAALMKNEGSILAWDRDKKIKLIDENTKRLGIKIVKTQINDSTIYKEENKNEFDYVMLDAPCSALGLIRRKPEIKYKDFSNIKELSNIQYKLLENASQYVKLKGEILYSTCSILKVENEDIISKFLQENKNFEIVKTFDKDTFRTDGTMGSDGFSMTKLRKIRWFI